MVDRSLSLQSRLLQVGNLLFYADWPDWPKAVVHILTSTIKC